MSVASKNPYDLLGNEDGDAEAAPGVKGAATARKDAKPQAAPRRTGGSANDAAFRDRNAGADRNRSKPTDEVAHGGARGGHAARVRGGRGSRYPRDRDDRHYKGLPSSSEKHAGGNKNGDAEKKDEEAGENIAKFDEKDASAEDTAAIDGEGEPEEKLMTLDDYFAQQAEKKLSLGDSTAAVRQANEGTKTNKQWAAAKPLVKEDDEAFIAGSGTKTKRERERKVKQVVEIDQRYVEPERPRGGARGGRGSSRGGERGGESFRGGRGGPRGGARGRGESRGDFRGGARGRGEPRGDFRGAPRGETRGDFRGAPRGGAPAGLNPKDESAFPSLGS